MREHPMAQALRRVGTAAWLLVGIAVVLWMLGLVAGRVSIVLVPLVLALFPAALLQPISAWLMRRGIPAALAAVLVILGSLLALVGLVAALVPPFTAELPQLTAAVTAGISQLDDLLNRLDLGPGLQSVDDVLAQIEEQVATADVAGSVVGAGTRVIEFGASTIFLLIGLFFYLKDGRRLFHGITDVMPREAANHADELGERVWWTVGAYFRGQILVAFVDALFIGLGLALLDVPLALPLATLVFFGGFFPIVGAFASGLVAVLVALADSGIGMALIVLALIIVVQQVEGNVLQPVIMSRATRLHPLTVIVAVTIGAVLMGVLGAFLAVPVAAALARTVDYIREHVDSRDAEGDHGDDARAPGDGQLTLDEALETVDGSSRPGRPASA